MRLPHGCVGCSLGELGNGVGRADFIKVGIVLPLTGTEAKFGEIEKNSFLLALEAINGAGGVNGRPIDLIIEKLGPLTFKSNSPIGISKTCSVLAQFDAICMINDCEDIADIAAGINRAMAERISKMTKKVGVHKEVAMTGGVAKNSGVVDGLKKVLNFDIVELNGVDPQIV